MFFFFLFSGDLSLHFFLRFDENSFLSCVYDLLNNIFCQEVHFTLIVSGFICEAGGEKSCAR